MPSTDRADCFIPHEDELASIFGSHLSLLVQGQDLYAAKDFKTGVNLEQLSKTTKLLCDLVRLDPRGAIFSQADVSKALHVVVNDPRFLTLNSEKWQQPESDARELTAYTVRVICSHMRICYDSCKDLANHALSQVFEIMTSAQPSSKQQHFRVKRRHHRLTKRQNPFVCFRVEENNDDEVENEPDRPTKVAKTFNGIIAKQLWSNGQESNADEYIAGEDGMLLAKWLGADSQHDYLQLDLPNSAMRNGIPYSSVGSSSAVRVAPVAPAGAPPAAQVAPPAAPVAPLVVPPHRLRKKTTMAGMPKTEAMDDGSEDTVPADIHDAVYKLKKGHHESWTLIVQSASSCKDKAQLITVTICEVVSAASPGQTPLEVCQKIEHNMPKPELMGNVKNNSKRLQELREEAKRFKNVALHDTT